MKLHFVDTMDQVLALALEQPLPKPMEEVTTDATQSLAQLPAPPPEGHTAHQ
jgi:hypothetical protein